MQSFTQSTGGDFQGSAQQVTTVVYGWGDINVPWPVLIRATTNTIFIFHFLVENRLSGGLVTNVHKDVFPLDLEPTESHVYVLLACCAAVILLLTEIRRPRRGLSLTSEASLSSRGSYIAPRRAPLKRSVPSAPSGRCSSCHWAGS